MRLDPKKLPALRTAAQSQNLTVCVRGHFFPQERDVPVQKTLHLKDVYKRQRMAFTVSRAMIFPPMAA